MYSSGRDPRPSHGEYSPVGLHHPEILQGHSYVHTNNDDDTDSGHDTISFQSNTHLNAPSNHDPTSYPPSATKRSQTDPSPRTVPIPEEGIPMSGYDAERAQLSGMPTSSVHGLHDQHGSWDLLAGLRKFEQSYEEYDPRNASEAHLAFADGDVPKNKVSRLYNYLLNVSIVSRWILFIVPVLAIIWIPGILAFTKFPNGEVWGVGLKWWSIWLSVVWVGWWAALAAARLLPTLARYTLGIVAVGTRRYIDWLDALNRYVALFAWTGIIWICWQPLIDTRQNNNASTESVRIVDLIGKLLFALYLCAAVLLFEKFSIQWIASKFHEKSYAERIADQKFAVGVLVTLYRNSYDIPGRTDTLRDAQSTASKHTTLNPKRFFRKALKGVRIAATTTTTALGNVASEIAGSSVLQPNSPQAMVQTALESLNKSRLLARRLFHSFAKKGHDTLIIEDIAQFFPTHDVAEAAFSLFDKDSNGDATRDEIEMACMEFHTEQLSIEHSMRDLDSAVGRLDNILMSVYVVVAVLIIAVALEAQLVTLVTGAGTLILGLSWLIGGSLQEVLTSIIFLFIKHPFDVGDRVDLSKDQSYTVKEIRLLSTIFLDGNGTLIQAPNTVLNTMFIHNIRRSPQMSETFTFEVHFNTTFGQLEALRGKMMEFLQAERRDFLQSFDVTVIDFPEQEKMTLKADIKYKSNWQQGALKAKRRNKWICALKDALLDVNIYGPSGNPDKVEDPVKYTLVPWETVQENEKKAAKKKHTELTEQKMPEGGWDLISKKTVLMENSDGVFEDGDEKRLTNLRRSASGQAMRQRSTPPASVTVPPVFPAPEDIEMSTRSVHK